MTKCKIGYFNADGRCQNVENIVISAKRWFDKVNGNTYHSVDVYANGHHIGRVPFAYGYDEAYLQTAHKLMQEKGIYPKTGEHLKSGADKDYYEFMMDKRENKNKFVIICTDVERKKEL